MCEKVVKEYSVFMFEYVPDRFKSREMCEQAVKENPYLLQFVPDALKRSEICEKAVSRDPWRLSCVPDRFITQAMREQAGCLCIYQSA